MEVIRVACAQASSVYLDKEATTHKVCRLVEEAGANGAQLVAFPEGFLPGHPTWLKFFAPTSAESRSCARRLLANAIEIPGPEIEQIANVARKNAVNVVLGVAEKAAGTFGTLYNTQVFIGADGSIKGKHQKLVPTGKEKLVHAAGRADTFGAIPMDLGMSSGLICGENLNPLAIFALAAQGARIHVMSWPSFFEIGALDMAERMMTNSVTVAQMMNSFVLSVCSVGSQSLAEAVGVDYEVIEGRAVGGSLIVGPNGKVLAGPLMGEEALLYADLDYDLAIDSTFQRDIVGHYNRPDIFSLKINKHTPTIIEFSDVAALPAE